MRGEETELWLPDYNFAAVGVVQTRADIAASFQRVAVQHLLDRCKRGVVWARDHHPDLKRCVQPRNSADPQDSPACGTASKMNTLDVDCASLKGCSTCK